jgi:tape measure domain-containing protein
MSDGEIVVKLSLDDGGYKVAVVNAGSVMREFKRSLDSTATSIKKVEEHQFSLGRKFRDLVMTMGALRFVVMDVNDIFLRLPLAILKTAGELERMQVLMTGLSKELTAAGRATEGLRDFKFVTNMAKNAPFEIAALSDSFVKLKVAGIDPTNGSMSALVDSVARFGGTGESLKRASVAIQQMAGKGVVSMEELRQQLGEAVPTAMQDMADGLGMSMQQLAKVVQTGTLEAGPAIAKMLVQMRINNEGAAADMMDTWVGMTARLKTEWDLTAKEIADAGFAREAKNAIHDVIGALQSDEFKKFGTEMGSTMGTVVRELLQVTKTLIQYREQIALVVQVWLAYKGVTALVAPLSRAMEGSIRGSVRSIRDEMGAVQASMLAKQIAAREMIANARAEEAAARDRTANVVQAKRLETALLQGENARILADYNRLQAALRAAELRGRGGVTMPGVQGAQSRDAVRAQVQDMKMAMDANSAAMRASAAEIRNHQAALVAANSATATAITNAGNLTNGLKAKGVAASAAGLAVRGLSGAIGLMGGPIGVTITAVMALVWWFQRAGAAADEAKARMDRATNNRATGEDLKAINAELAEAEAKLAKIRADNATKEEFRKNMGGASKAAKETNARAAEAEAKALLEAENKVNALRKAAGEAKLTVIEEGGRAQADRIDTAVRRVVDKLEEGSRLEIRAIEARQRKALEQEKKDSKEYVEVSKRFNAEKQQALVKGVEQRGRALAAAAERAEADALKYQDGSSERAGGMTAAKKLRADAQQMETELANLKGTLASVAGFKPPKDDKDKGSKSLGDKDTPFGRLVESIAADAKALQAELDNFNDLEGKADKAAGIAAKLKERWKQNEFKDPKTGKNPSEAEMDLAIAGAVANQKAKDEQKKREDLAQKAKDFADFVKGMEPEYLDAIEVLMDPTSKTKMGRSEKRVEKMLAGMTPEELTAAAQRMGTTIEQARAQLINQAQAIDSVSFFQNVEKETEQINASLVEDSRLAAVARMTADNERHAQEMRNLYEKRQASGQATGEELLQLQRIMEASVTARASRLANESKTPFEKLASQWDNVTRNMEEATARWAESTMDAIGTMVTTGKMDFKGLAVSILADMAKIAAKAALSPLMKGAGSFFSSIASNWFADGGIMTEFGSVPLKKYANGGVANSPQMAIFGEGKTPEAYVPLPDGRTIPVTLKGAGGGGDSVMINITVNNDGSSKTESSGPSTDDVYKRMGERIKAVVREELMSESRPGGVLYR